MKRLFKIFAIEIVGLYIASQIATGMEFTDQLAGMVITGIGLAFATRLIKPIINILILPLTLATLGLFKFIGHTITLYIVDLAMPQFNVVGFHFAGTVNQYFSIPAINFDNRIMAYIAFSIVISVVTMIIGWIVK